MRVEIADFEKSLRAWTQIKVVTGVKENIKSVDEILYALMMAKGRLLDLSDFGRRERKAVSFLK